ncbi:hypothetical protein Tco_1442154 [Tanacetum coccineum]
MSDGNNGNSVVTKAHLPTIYSRKKHSGTQVSAIYGKEGTQRKNKGARTSPISFDGQGSNASPEQKRF